MPARYGDRVVVRKSVTRDPAGTLPDMEARTERDSFERLVREHQHAVCAIAYAVTRDRARSEELAQEAFLVAWRYRDRVEVVTAGWICAIARNLARNAARRRKEVAMESEPAASAPDVRERMIDRETEERAIAALAELPAIYRDAIVLYYRGDQSMSAVAEALGVSEDTARQRVHRGRAKLRDALAPVVSTLGATRPGAAFTAACVAVWLVRGSTVDASDALPTTTAATGIGLAIAGALASACAVIGLAVTGTPIVDASREPARGASTHTSTAPASGRSPVLASIHARFPAAANSHRPPAGFTALAAPTGTTATTQMLDLDFGRAPVKDMAMMIAFGLDTPVWVDPAVDAEVNIRAHHVPALDALDEVVAQAGAIRTEVAAIRLVTFGGRTDAAQLGGDAMSLQIRDAPLADVLAPIEAQLHMPIGRLALPDPPCAKTGECEVVRGPAPSPRITLDVRDLPAGAVLEQVLAQAHLGYEVTTGFAITPDPDDD